ncbi:MAG: Vitamin B12 transport ATP-binding protein BacA [Chlamydiia bacterium]|nr:Vitamin B12 transport ATP-binding protein BacA [Chlamydiia bacterium]
MCILGSLGCSFIFVRVAVRINTLTGKLYDHVEKLEKREVAQSLKLLAATLIVYMMVYALRLFLEALAAFWWRKDLSKRLVSKWLANRSYHHIKGAIDNPDQRICEDVELFCNKILDTIFSLITQGMTFAAFIGVLWHFPHPLHLDIWGKELIIPHFLAWGSLIYACLANILLITIGKPLVKLNYEKEKKEANYRFSLMRLHTHSEEVAFFRGEACEEKITQSRFKEIESTYFGLIRQNFAVNLFRFGYKRSLSILPVLAALPLYFSDQVSFGQIMRMADAASCVLVALGIVISQFQKFATLQAAKNRLIGLLHAIEKEEEIKHIRGANHLGVANLSMEISGRALFFQPLNLTILRGQKTLLVGMSGTGKTTLLRCLSGLIRPSQGRVLLPKDAIYFVPQRPYLPLGTLRSCLDYPYPLPHREPVITRILEEVGLPYLVSQLDQVDDYLKKLSAGEIQRLTIARILLSKPDILVMDEPTSALDEANEQLMFDLIERYLPKNKTLLTVSHHASLAHCHDRVEMLPQANQFATI